MKKTITSIFLIFQLFNLFAQTGISADLFFPDRIKSGKSFTLNLKIKKPADFRPFTSFTQSIPEGFFVKPVNIRGATFSFKENILTLSWIRLPEGENIDIFYEISHTVGTVGKFSLSGNIKYLINNKKGEINLKSKTFEIFNNTDSEKSRTPYTYNNIKCTRDKIPLTDGKVLVKIKISGLNKTDFILTEQIPLGYNFNIVDASETSVKAYGQTLQFVADKLSKAEKNPLILKYEITPKQKVKKNIIIYGKLSFIDKNNIINIPVVDSP